MIKLMIIGIDGIDRDLVAKYIDYLPNFQKLIQRSIPIVSTSVFPPDSDTAWASIYTGLNPARHGVVDFVDPLERMKITQKESKYFDINAIKGRTFWDIAGRFNKKVCLIYPHLAFPVWKVNGFMINPHPETEKFQMYPPDFKFNFNLKKLEVQKRIPRTKFEFSNYLKKKQRIVRNEFDFGKEMLTNYNWDIFFLYTSALDSIMHIFWNYCDPDDPTYPGPNPFQNAIKDFHILHDNLIGEMLTHVDSNTAVLLFSDHGHYMRPINLFNINEVLRKEGLLFAKDGIIAPVYNSSEKIKRWAVNIAQKSGLRPAAQTILRIFPSIKKMYTNPSTIDFDRTIAHCIDLSGMKSYSYGGITIAKEKLKSESEYIKVKKRIVKILSRLEIPGTGEKAVEWIKEKEELYHGPYIDKYPDIIFNLKDMYGAGWAIKVPIFSKTVAHKFYPGSHRGATPIFYMLNPSDKECIKQDITLMDIAPTILDLIDINWKEFDFDGESIFK